MRKILCAVDGSEQSLKAAEMAARLAKDWGAPLVLLTVARPVRLPSRVRDFLREENLLGEASYILEPMTEGVLDEAQARAHRVGATQISALVREGHPARTIVDFARKEQCDAIVLGSRGHGDSDSNLLGSVSHKVTTLAHCSVFIVR